MEDNRELVQAGYRYAIALAGEPQDARDLVHEAWLRLQSYSEERVSRPLLYTTVRNLYVDLYRRTQRMDAEPFDETATYAVGSQLPPDSHISHDELAAQLNRLAPAEREALHLNVVEGYTAHEIAEFTQRPRGTVLSLIHRARKKLREALTDGDEVALYGRIRVVEP